MLNKNSYFSLIRKMCFSLLPDKMVRVSSGRVNNTAAKKRRARFVQQVLKVVELQQLIFPVQFHVLVEDLWRNANYLPQFFFDSFFIKLFGLESYWLKFSKE
jgi:hypothetical protein